MFRARKQLGKRQTADNGNGFRPKKFRTDQQVPTFDEAAAALAAASGLGTAAAAAAASSSSADAEDAVSDGGPDGGRRREGEDAAANVSKYARRIVRGQTGNVLLDCEIPRYGTLVERMRCRKAGDFVIGYELGTSPGVPQTQYLARKQGTNEFYLLKILSFDPETEVVDKDTLQGKVLLHNEFTLLSMLDDMEGVIRQHGFFSDYAFEERQIERDDGSVQSIYTGRIRRRLILVLDCVHAHEFAEESGAFVSLQRHISAARISERDALELFYEVVKVVEQLHARNIIHRDLKLNNIVLNRRTGRIVLTNFFLGKHLINEQECLFDQRGSPAYISPDVLGGKPYRGKPSDMWALGVILYTIVYGKFPFHDTTPTALFRKIRDADYTIPSGFNTSQETKSLIKRMLTLNPDERLTATEVRFELEQSLRKFRRPRINVDQLVPELSDRAEPPTPGLEGATRHRDQSIPIEGELGANGGGFSADVPAASEATVVPPEPMEVDPVGTTMPRYDLSTEQFSRVLEAHTPTAPPKPKKTAKKVTLFRFSSAHGDHHLSAETIAAAAGRGRGPQHLAGGLMGSQQQQEQQDRRSQADMAGAGAGAGIVNAAGAGAGTETGAGAPNAPLSGAGANRSRFNFNLNLQYTASSYNSAARAVAAAVAAVRNAGGSGGSGPGRTRMEWTRNGVNGSAPGTQPNGSSPLAPGSDQPEPVNPVGGPVVGDVTSSPPGNANRPPLPPAAQRLYSIMNYISLVNRTMGSHFLETMVPPDAASDPDSRSNPFAGVIFQDFNGVISPLMAERIQKYLRMHLRGVEWIEDIFRVPNVGGVSDGEHRVNVVLELLRQLGVRMESSNGQVVICPDQLRDRQMFLRLLLRIAGYNDKYFVSRSHQHPR
ncbi:uncharacterized protein LOC128723880 [Anopheles nili]|uniref:uncharacterized protein LOC128723880 n=1 Tax=Anopheles nili TaxID=185578 RepID=UPI00237AC497|nr:uncharacterized protein LOC128723880 [Anopheles nili]